MAEWMKFNLQYGSTHEGQQLLRETFFQEAFQVVANIIPMLLCIINSLPLTVLVFQSLQVFY